MSQRHKLGLDQPLYLQLAHYIAQLFTGNFGTSLGPIFGGQNVMDVIMQRLPATVELAVGSMLVATIIGISVGILSGINRDRIVDVVGRLYGTIISVIRFFCLGLMHQFV